MSRRIVLCSYNGPFSMEPSAFSKVCDELGFDQKLFCSQYTYDDSELIETNYPELISQNV